MQALSIPTWIIHVSSVIEWGVAIWLIWTYGEVSRNPAWRMLSLAMLPALVSAMCACTWHLFNNPASLDWLVTVQALMTLVGNIALWAAAWWIWRSFQSQSAMPAVDSAAHSAVDQDSVQDLAQDSVQDSV